MDVGERGLRPSYSPVPSRRAATERQSRRRTNRAMFAPVVAINVVTEPEPLTRAGVGFRKSGRLMVAMKSYPATEVHSYV